MRSLAGEIAKGSNRESSGDSTFQVQDRRHRRDPSTDLAKLLLICLLDAAFYRKRYLGDARSLISEIDCADLPTDCAFNRPPRRRLLAGLSGQSGENAAVPRAPEEKPRRGGGETTKSRRIAANAISTGDNGTFNKTCRASARS